MGEEGKRFSKKKKKKEEEEGEQREAEVEKRKMWRRRVVFRGKRRVRWGRWEIIKKVRGNIILIKECV